MLVDMSHYDDIDVLIATAKRWAKTYPVLNFDVLIDVTGPSSMKDIFQSEEGIQWADAEKLFVF